MKVQLDQSVRFADHNTLIGGTPRRLLRLSTAGQAAIKELTDAHAESTAARLLARRLIDAGIAHPRPKPCDPRGLVTVVIPVRDRPRELARCLQALDSGIEVIVVDDGSTDSAAIAAALAASHGVHLLRREGCGGPAAARNAALPSVNTELIAFLDSDCIPSGRWLHRLVGHFEDPEVGAVAPRVRPSITSQSVIGRYLSARSPLDMGARAAAVHPGSHVSYLPSAALIVRRVALDGGFHEKLRYGEDVDLVWRLGAAGWHVRYDPSTIVEHQEPRSLRSLLKRRFRYGTSAAPLHARHPGKLAATRLDAATAASAGLLAVKQPRAAGTLMAASAARALIYARRRRLPVRLGLRWHAEAIANTLLALGNPAATLGVPVATMIGLGRRPRAVLGLIAVPALLDWCGRRPRLDPLRWTLTATLDDLAYALGVYRGCIQHRDGQALLPTLVVRTGRWRPLNCVGG